MSEWSKVCIICKEGEKPSRNLLNNRPMIDDLLSCCQERVTLGQSNLQELTGLLEGMSDEEKNLLHYHSECRKPIVNKVMIKRLSEKMLTDTLDNTQKGPGRPSSSASSVRPKRIKVAPKAEVCVFVRCSFCCDNQKDPLHRVLSDNMGETLLTIKQDTRDNEVRVCVSQLQDAGDASALEMYYHRKCLILAQRTCLPVGPNPDQLIRTACDEELILSVQNTLVDDEVLINMSNVNDEYLSILKRYQVSVAENENHRKHLKQLICDRLPDVQFVKSVRKNEPEKLVLPRAVAEAIDIRSAFLNEEKVIGYLKIIAKKLREDIMPHRDWTFNGNFDDFKNPPLLQFFLTQVLFGQHVHKVSGVRNEEVDKTVNVACQLLVQNTRTDRQVKHESEKNIGFLQNVQTPLSVGLPLAVHLRVRDKSLLHNLTELYIGSHYQKILNIEKCVQQGVIQRMGETGGFCFPDFVKKGVNVWFAVDNIDLLEDTPTGQNTFHGTVIVMNQRADEGEPVNEPLVLPERLSPTPLAMKITYMKEPSVRPRPIRFQNYQVEKRKNLLSSAFTHTWALANYFGADDHVQSDSKKPDQDETGLAKDNEACQEPEVIELIKCGCTTECARRCSCCKNGLSCTPLCKCFAKNCSNFVVRSDVNDDDIDE